MFVEHRSKGYIFFQNGSGLFGVDLDGWQKNHAVKLFWRRYFNKIHTGCPTGDTRCSSNKDQTAMHARRNFVAMSCAACDLFADQGVMQKLIYGERSF